MSNKSNLDLVSECDSFPYSSASTHATDLGFYSFKCRGYNDVLGLVPIHIAKAFPVANVMVRNDENRELIFDPQLNSESSGDFVEKRTEVIARYLDDLRRAKVFRVLEGWRNELYPVYNNAKTMIFSMERSASWLFGIVTYGVHLTAYTHTTDGLRIWSPKRSPTKSTYPNMLDNTVAGGLATGEKPFSCMLRECFEEASLPESIARKAKTCGAVTYFYIRDERAGGEVGLCQPECEYVYDLELPADVVPKPNDNEAVDFQALSIEEVKAAMAQGRYKPNCAIVLLDFFIRHGYLTPENEPDYLEIVSRIHRRLDFPMR